MQETFCHGGQVEQMKTRLERRGDVEQTESELITPNSGGMLATRRRHAQTAPSPAITAGEYAVASRHRYIR